MGRRRKAREFCLQILFQLEFCADSLSLVLEEFWSEREVPNEIKEYTEWLVKGVVAQEKIIDELIQSVSRNWKLERMSVVDRNILRLAVFELMEESHLQPAIIINEAIEIAKKFSTEKAAVFINGLLDAVRKKLELDKTASQGKIKTGEIKNDQEKK